MKDFKDYERFPIIVSPHAVCVLHIFERTDHFEDIVWMDDFEPKWHEDIEMYKRAADQFINQLEGVYCDLFLEALREKCDELLTEREERKKQYLKHIEK